MSNDKKTRMAKANQKFQERLRYESKMAQDEGKVEKIEMPDINPRLTNLIGNLMKNQ
jgi:hypothetical protein